MLRPCLLLGNRLFGLKDQLNIHVYIYVYIHHRRGSFLLCPPQHLKYCSDVQFCNNKVIQLLILDNFSFAEQAILNSCSGPLGAFNHKSCVISRIHAIDDDVWFSRYIHAVIVPQTINFLSIIFCINCMSFTYNPDIIIL